MNDSILKKIFRSLGTSVLFGCLGACLAMMVTEFRTTTLFISIFLIITAFCFVLGTFYADDEDVNITHKWGPVATQIKNVLANLFAIVGFSLIGLLFFLLFWEEPGSRGIVLFMLVFIPMSLLSAFMKHKKRTQTKND